MKIPKVLAGTAIILCLTATSLLAAPQPGKSDQTFNKKFIMKIKPMMPYDQLVKIVGTPGNGKTASGVASYHWDGDRHSALDVKTVQGKVVEASVLTPRQRKITLDKNGKFTGLSDW